MRWSKYMLRPSLFLLRCIVAALSSCVLLDVSVLLVLQYAGLYYFNKIMHSCTKCTDCQINDSHIEYNCKISRQKTTLTETLKHTTSSV